MLKALTRRYENYLLVESVNGAGASVRARAI